MRRLSRNHRSKFLVRDLRIFLCFFWRRRTWPERFWKGCVEENGPGCRVELDPLIHRMLFEVRGLIVELTLLVRAYGICFRKQCIHGEEKDGWVGALSGREIYALGVDQTVSHTTKPPPMPGLEPQVRFIAHSSNFADIDLKSTRSYLIHRLKTEVSRVHRHESQSFHPSVYVETSGNDCEGVAKMFLIDRVSGLVLMDWRVGELNLPDIPSSELETAARKASARMVRCVSLKPPKDASRVSFMETHVGCATVLITQHLTRPEGEKPLLDYHSYQRCVSILRSAVKLALYRPVQSENVPLMPYDGCEVLYGRAGLLYALLFLRSNTTAETYSDVPLTGEIKNLISFDTLRKFVDDVIDRGAMGAEATRPPGVAPSAWSPLMWSWHHKLYLGAAHGVGESRFEITLDLGFYSTNSGDTPNGRLVPVGHHRRTHSNYFANCGVAAACTMRGW